MIQESMGLKYEPASEPLHSYVEWLFAPLSARIAASGYNHKDTTVELRA